MQELFDFCRHWEETYLFIFRAVNIKDVFSPVGFFRFINHDVIFFNGIPSQCRNLADAHTGQTGEFNRICRYIVGFCRMIFCKLFLQKFHIIFYNDLFLRWFILLSAVGIEIFCFDEFNRIISNPQFFPGIKNSVCDIAEKLSARFFGEIQPLDCLNHKDFDIIAADPLDIFFHKICFFKKAVIIRFIFCHRVVAYQLILYFSPHEIYILESVFL